MTEEVESPEGIGREHIHDSGRSPLQRWPAGFAGLTVVVMLSLVGLFGAEGTLTAHAEGVSLTVDAPTRIRNGQLYEMVITVETTTPVQDAVVVVAAEVWRDVTINTLIPSPSEEEARDGAFAFSFGQLDAGERLVVKIDAQINPNHAPVANDGRIAVADGEEELAGLDYRMEVLP